MLWFLTPRSTVLVVAIGGGGDVASAAMIASAIERYGCRSVLASIAWERYIYDPVPGPVRLSEIVNPLARGEHYVVVSGDSYAIRGGRVVKPQASLASKALSRPVYVVDMYSGVEGYVEGLREITSVEGVDHVIGVDVGGDSLASGVEEDLWSPLADWVGLAAISRLNGVLAVHSPGSDGELSQSYIMSRVDKVALKSGLLGVTAMSELDAEVLEKTLKHVNSEASRVSLLAYRGFRGLLSLRRGSRFVEVTLLSTLTFYLKAPVIVELVEPAQRIQHTRSLEEARRILNNMGIYTELDLEEDLANLGVKPEELTGELLVNIRERGRSVLSRRTNTHNSSYKPH
ncbi:MAG: DUF1152 domain-containing protein [Desulfurococcaceae archaeon]|nr:DUF1152 domain-containing protein [Desulfurococcaceae archaeon]MCC6053148.1 DUF1152 domain-containing protein [Desulfurococcaceae archaeon]